MAWDPSRRVFLKGASLAAVGIGLGPSSLMVRAAEAASSGPGVLVKVFLRGGCDGLNLLVPHGEPEYFNLRQGIAIRDAVPLDSYFGLHPALSALRQLYADGRLAFVTAVGSYGLTRSHFDAQDFMETGTPGDKTTNTGWLDRSVAAIPGSEVTQAVSFSTQLPRSYMGGEPVLVAQNLTQFDLRARNWRDEAERQLRAMYGHLQTPVGRMGQETFSAITTILRTPELVAPPANGAAYPAGTIGTSLRQAAQLIKAGLGTRSIYVNVPGAFDTHSNQLFNNTAEFQRIGDALLAFQTDLGRAMDDVVLMVTTEFGRTAAVNGSAGTDHGSGYTMIVMGGGVRGGRVYGQWPGLRRDQLYQQRDLAVTTDFRDVFAEVARTQLGVSASTLFPGYSGGAGLGIVG